MLAVSVTGSRRQSLVVELYERLGARPLARRTWPRGGWRQQRNRSDGQHAGNAASHRLAGELGHLSPKTTAYCSLRAPLGHGLHCHVGYLGSFELQSGLRQLD